MKKILALFLFVVFLFANTNTTVSVNTADNNVTQQQVEKIEHEDFVKKWEFTTFCTQENLQNNPIRKMLNEFIVFLKEMSVKNILYAILAFLVYYFLYFLLVVILFAIIKIDPRIIAFIVLLLVPASDLYYNNPLAILGFWIDWILTGIKLFLAIFGIYVSNIGNLFMIIGGVIGAFVVLGLFAGAKESSKVKKAIEAVKGIFYIVAMADGRLSRQEETFLKNMIYNFAKEMDIDTKIAKEIGKNEAAEVSADNLEKYIKDLDVFFEKNKKLKKYLLDDLIQFSLIDGLNEQKKDLLYKIADILGVDIGDLEEYINQKFGNFNQETENSATNDDVYRVLGVDKDVSCDELKKKYRELAQKYHPDKISSKGLDEEFVKFAEDMFKKVNDAYEYLKKLKNCK